MDGIDTDCSVVCNPTGGVGDAFTFLGDSVDNPCDADPNPGPVSSAESAQQTMPIECEAILYYRPLNHFTGKLGATHSYWRVIEYDPNTSTFILDEIIGAGPFRVGGKKYLDDEQHSSYNDATYSGLDTVTNGKLWYTSGLSASNCDGVNSMIGAATVWPQDTFLYNNGLPPVNSNTFAESLGAVGGFNPNSPPGSWGWYPNWWFQF